MKGLVTALTAATLLADVSAANAGDPQATGAELDWQLSRQVATRPVYAFAPPPRPRRARVL